MSFKSFAHIFIFAILISIAFSQTQFTGKVTITNDPNLGQGSLLTVDPIYYDSVLQVIRYDFPNLRDPTGNATSKGFKEIIDYKNQVYYQLCSKCSTYTNGNPILKFFKETSDINAPISSNRLAFVVNGKTCDAYQKLKVENGGILYVWTQSDGTICRAERTDGTIYNFSNIKAGAPNPSVFSITDDNKCPPQPRCSAPIDLVLVLDESGSINRKEWAQLITFATGVVNSFVVGPNDTQIGLVFFSGVQYATGENPASCCGLSDPALPLSFDADTINKFLLTHVQTGGHTCINCGIKSATTYEPNRNRPVQVNKVMLVFSDGFNNRMTDFFQIDIQNAKNAGWNIFAIGVNETSSSQLIDIASSPDQVFRIDNFDALEKIAKAVVFKLCGAFPNLTPCGPICKGKCGCGGLCICPDTCVSPDNCKKGSCVNGVSGSQCLFTETFCDPFATNGNLCKTNVCDKTTGNCTLIDKNCTALATDTCFTQTCDPAVGCTLKDSCPPIQKQPGTDTNSLCFDRVCANNTCTVSQKNCNINNACAVNSCDAKLGCISVPINCDDGNMCTTDTCDKATGCVYTKIDCPSKEFLNSTTFKNNLCSTFKCDPAVGCTSSPKTCDDNNVCTTDSCDPTTGNCRNIPIVCTASTNKCITVSCDAKAGCINVTKNCDDNNFCTTDSCDPATGNCLNVKLSCTASNDTCFTNECDSAARKCVLKPKVICNQPSNKCLTTSCQNGTCGASVTFPCPPLDLCSTSICDPTKGCSYLPKVCNDNNTCTTDSCDATTGNCAFVPIPGCTPNITCTNCVSTNPCSPSVCENGTCITKPFTCPVNLCAKATPTVVGNACQCVASNATVCSGARTACGESVCDPATGVCGTVNNRVCNDNDPCTNDVCVLVGGVAKCNFTQITCPGDSPCSRKKCVANNGVPSCVDDKISNSLNCTSSDCSVGVCNPSTGTCQFTPTTCGNPSNTTCARNVCNPVTLKCEATAGITCPDNDPVGCGSGGVCVLLGGVQTCKYNPSCTTSDNGCISTICKVFSNGTVCQQTNFTCDDNNPCTNDVCIPDGVDDKGKPKSKCQSTPFNCPPSTDPCALNICANVNGKPVCQSTAITCNSTSKCLTGKCVVENGKGVCKFNETKCGTPDKCTNFVCDPVKGCQTVSKCNDNNPCTNDLCDVATGKCTFTNLKCNSTSLCKKGVCDPNIGCVEQPIDCALDKNITAADNCHFVVCVNTTGCSIAVIPNTLDNCGFCNKPGKCPANRKSTVPAGAIAGAVIGGAFIAGVLALGIGLFCASSGATGFAGASQVQMSGGSNNPLYTDGDVGGSNMMTENDYVEMNN